MRLCSYCGKEVPKDEAAFCVYCGNSVAQVRDYIPVVSSDSETWQCPNCASLISNYADQCNFCGHTRVVEAIAVACPHCEQENPKDATKCESCGKYFHTAAGGASDREWNVRRAELAKSGWTKPEKAKARLWAKDWNSVGVCSLIFIGLVGWSIYNEATKTPAQKAEEKAIAAKQAEEQAEQQRAREAEQLARDQAGLETEALLMSQTFVKKRLKAPSTANFPWISDDGVKVAYLGDGRYSVSAYVDAENSFGAKLRSRYVCILKYVGKETWQLESVDIH